MDIDVKKVMLTLLERQKEYVIEDREDYSEGMVAVFTTDGGSYIAFPKFEDEAGKIAEYGAIVEKAKEGRGFDDHSQQCPHQKKSDRHRA